MKNRILMIIGIALITMANTCNGERDAILRGSIVIKKGSCYPSTTRSINVVVTSMLSGTGLAGSAGYSTNVNLTLNEQNEFVGTYTITAHNVKVSNTSTWSVPTLDQDVCTKYTCIPPGTSVTDTSSVSSKRCIRVISSSSSSIKAEGQNGQYDVQHNITIDCQCVIPRGQ